MFKTIQKPNVIKDFGSIAKNSIFLKLQFKAPINFVPPYYSAMLHFFLPFFFGQLSILDIVKIWG